MKKNRDIFKKIKVEEKIFVGMKKRKKDEMEEEYEMFKRMKERRRNIG